MFLFGLIETIKYTSCFDFFWFFLISTSDREWRTGGLIFGEADSDSVPGPLTKASHYLAAAEVADMRNVD